jgi:hypothetical protein
MPLVGRAVHSVFGGKEDGVLRTPYGRDGVHGTPYERRHRPPARSLTAPDAPQRETHDGPA